MRTLLITLHVIFILGCSSSLNHKNITPLKEHMVKSDKLRVLMLELNEVTSERYKSELEKDDTRRRYALSLAETLEKLSSNVKDMPKSELTGLSKNKIGLYDKYASRLNENAKEIKQIAMSYELEKLPSAIESMHSTCRACHNDVRDKK